MVSKVAARPPESGPAEAGGQKATESDLSLLVGGINVWVTQVNLKFP